MNRWSSLAAVCAAALMIGGGLVIHREVAVARSLERLERQAAVLRGEQQPPQHSLSMKSDAPPRVLLADALFLARQGGDPRDQRRRAELLAAEEAAKAVIRRRPYSGDAWVVRALVRAQFGGPDDPQAVAALEQSYRLAPFLRNAAEWRIGSGFAVWGRLAPPTRKRLLNEAIIYAQLNGPARVKAFELARGTDAYVPLSLAWHARSTR